MKAPIATLAAMAMPDDSHGSTPLRKSHPAITIASAVTEPTERSIPPEISRMVIPTTTMPSTAKAIGHGPHVRPGQKMRRRERHSDEQDEQDQDQPGLAHLEEGVRRSAPARAARSPAHSTSAGRGPATDSCCHRTASCCRSETEARCMMFSSVMASPDDLAADLAFPDDDHPVADADQLW